MVSSRSTFVPLRRDADRSALRKRDATPFPHGGIRFSAVQKRPYRIGSVDHALRLATLLVEVGPLGVTEASAHLGVAPSTAHRLLTTLVYRDFAEQGPDRRYRAGPMLRGSEERPSASLRLQEAARPRLGEVVSRTNETCSVQVLVGRDVLILDSVGSTELLRVASRRGARMPAHRASGGLVLLAALTDEEVEHRMRGLGVDEERQLRHDLAAARRDGYAVNDQRSDPGVSAIAVPIVGPLGRPVAAVALAMPAVRFDRSALPSLAGVLHEAARRIAADLVEER
jgi:IclR family transcriptional regulator, acetate operon repressor